MKTFTFIAGLATGVVLALTWSMHDLQKMRGQIGQISRNYQEALVEQQKRNEAGTNRVFYAFNQDELQDAMARAQIGDVVKVGSMTISNQLVWPGNNVTTNVPTEEFTITNSYRVDFKRGYWTNLTGTNIPISSHWPPDYL